jgi:hypothetical protein
MNILQDKVYAISILQANIFRIAIVFFRLSWFKVHEFGLIEFRTSRNFILKLKLLRLVERNSRLLLEFTL